MDYCTKQDVISLFRPLTDMEGEKAEALIPIVSERIRQEAFLAGKDFTKMLAENPSLLIIAKQVSVDVIARALMAPTDASGALTQMSESALGYTVSGTYFNAGGGLFIKKEELRMLGIRKQKIGVIELC